jgi:arylsulfatase A-like enzyme
MARLFDKKSKPEDFSRILEQYAGEISELVAALIAGDADVDLKLAALVENLPQHVRVAIVEKMREMVRERDEEKSQKLDAYIQHQKTLAKQQKHQLMQQWLAYFMSQETLRKIRESFMAMPGLERQVKNLGEELAKNGVLQNIQLTQKQDLGELSATVRNQQSGRNQGQQR